MQQTPESIASGPADRRDRTTLIKRLGLAGFLFFLIKGLAWLIVPALIAGGIWRS